MAASQERPAPHQVASPPPPPAATKPTHRPQRRITIAAVPAAPHTRPGDQNALCLETDQA